MNEPKVASTTAGWWGHFQRVQEQAFSWSRDKGSLFRFQRAAEPASLYLSSIDAPPAPQFADAEFAVDALGV